MSERPRLSLWRRNCMILAKPSPVFNPISTELEPLRVWDWPNSASDRCWPRAIVALVLVAPRGQHRKTFAMKHCRSRSPNGTRGSRSCRRRIWDLVLWLIGTHHGYGRPFFPPVTDPTPNVAVHVDELVVSTGDAPLKLDQGWFERAERVVQCFGPWELARLEAILRLADHAASADEQRNSVDRSLEGRLLGATV